MGLRKLIPLLLVAALVTGSCKGPEPEVPPTLDVGEAVDAGDEAFVRRVVPLLWGRYPRSTHEVRALVQVVEQSDRPTLIRGMAGSEEYRRQWEGWLLQVLQVNRDSFRVNPQCYDRLGTQGQADSSALAAFVRDGRPTDAAPPELDFWTMRDLIRSALLLDDISVVWRAQLFAQLARDFPPLDAENAAGRPFRKHLSADPLAPRKG